MSKVTLESLGGKLEAMDIKFDSKFGVVDKRFSALEKLIIENDKQMKVFVEEKIDQLAISTAKGFADVDMRFKEVHVKFNEMDERFDTIDARFIDVDKRFEQMDERFNQTDERLNRIEFKSIDNGPRILVLEDKMRIVSAKLGLQS